MTNITGLLLAAGQSTRFGSDKLLHILDNGKSIAQQAAEKIIHACPDSLAIINKNSPELKKILTNSGLNIIENNHSKDGMGSSIACGVKTLNHADACLIALADMPFIEPETIKTLLKKLTNTPCIIAPSYKNQRGHPVLFSRHFFSELIQLDGDMGARDIIKNNQAHLMLVDTDDAGVIWDIDTKDDLEIKDGNERPTN